MAKPNVYDTFVAYGEFGKIEWADGYVGGVRFVGYPDRLLVIHGQMNDVEKEVARNFCKSVMGK